MGQGGAGGRAINHLEIVGRYDELVSGIVLRTLAARSGDNAMNSSPNPKKPPRVMS